MGDRREDVPAAEVARAAGGERQGLALPRRVLASWERSQEYGVPLATVDPAFSGTVDRDSPFYECGVAVLTGLQATLADEPVSLMLTDADGLVLSRHAADPALLRALDGVHLAPGFSYAEHEVGTNGLGLALADRAPTLVRADEHYSLDLVGYTCAAAPVLDPLTGRLEGAVNLTTWSRSSSGLLLALAQSAAASTAAMMLARVQGRSPRPLPRGEVARVESARREPGAGTLTGLSRGWTDPLDRAAEGVRAGRVVLVLGEPGSGRATLLAQALRREHARRRILSARTPAAQDVETWLGLWTPELGKADTSVVVGDVDTLPSWAAQALRSLLPAGPAAPATPPVLALTAAELDRVPAGLAALVDSVVALPPLRERPDDVLPLAEHLARRARGRAVAITDRAGRALRDHPWVPGNTARLARVVATAASQSDTVDLQHLPPDVLGSGRRLSRLEVVERDEIVRALTRPGATVKQAAEALGMSRATVYRKLAQYDIRVPGRRT